jgi:hypothetical protein
VLELALPTEPELIESPRGDESVEDPFAKGWIWGRAGSRSLNVAGLVV